MRRPLRILAPMLGTAVVAAITFGSFLPAHAAGTVAPDPADASVDFAWINGLRAAAGVAPVQVQPWAVGVAQAHSLDMASQDLLFHNLTGYMDVGHSAMSASFLGENVAMGTNLSYAQAALQASPPHMAILLDPRYNYVGVAAATDASGQVWVTEDFAEINTAAPKPVVVAAPKPVAPKPVAPVVIAAVAPKATPAPAPAPAVVVPLPTLPAPPATPVVSPKPVTPPATSQLTSQVSHAHSGVLLLYVGLTIVGCLLALGAGYRLTRAMFVR